MTKNITFLGIETSCDETAAAVIRENDKGTADVLSNIVSSQIDEHKKFGGVVPELAARAHLENIEYIINTALKKSEISINEMDGIAATAGPGLINKEIDVAVHSLKDMESTENKKLLIGAYIRRNDFRDVIISKKIKNINDLKDGVKIGSSSRRRELQLKKINKKISVINIRGNIDTRINKISENNLDGIILAAAGVNSLKLNEKIGFTFECDQILPAVGQGIIAVQCRKDDEIKNLIKKINDNTTSLCAIAERRMLQTIGGDCETAVAGLAEIENHNLKLRAQLFSDNGEESFEHELIGRDTDASFIGESVGEKLLKLAGEKFKKE